MTLEDQLNKFREQWHGVHVTQHDDCLVYNVVHGFAKSASFRANQLIEELELPLTAEMSTDNSFIVKTKENEKRKKQY